MYSRETLIYESMEQAAKAQHQVDVGRGAVQLPTLGANVANSALIRNRLVSAGRNQECLISKGKEAIFAVQVLHLYRKVRYRDKKLALRW